MKTAIPVPIEQIRQICRKYDVIELYIFGSVLRDDFRADSDVDFVVAFREGTSLGPRMTRLFDLQEELASLFGRPVDIVLKKEVEQSENPVRKREVLMTMEPIVV